MAAPALWVNHHFGNAVAVLSAISPSLCDTSLRCLGRCRVIATYADGLVVWLSAMQHLIPCKKKEVLAAGQLLQ